MAEKVILYDATRCTACRGCQAACKQWNENDEVIPTVENGVEAHNWGSYENPPALSANTWVRMTFTEDGKYFETEFKPMKYTIEENHVQIKPLENEKSIKGELFFDIVYLKDNEMLLQWSYNKGSSIYTKYGKGE